MAKILITSIGSGRYDRDTREKKYNKAKYYAGENRDDFQETAYIFSALRRFQDIDRCIFVGTCGSNWFLFYESLYDPNSGVGVTPATPYDEKYSESLLEIFEPSDNAIKKAEMDVEDFQNLLQPLKEALSELDAEIIILKYGRDTEENLWNFTAFASIGKFVKDGDSLCFDITHSFRSLAFYELLAVSYFKDVLKKNISIDFVSYGMLEYSGENGGLTPIVDLSILVHAMDWIKAAEEYNRFGTAKLLAELLERNQGIGVKIGVKERNALTRLGSTAIAANGFSEFKNLIRYCCGIVNNVDSGNAEMNVILGHIFRDLAKRFGQIIDKNKNDELLYMELSKWHFEKGRYMESTICAVEGILDWAARECNIRRTRSGEENEEIRKRFIKAFKIVEKAFCDETYLQGSGSLEEVQHFLAKHHFLKQYNTARKIRNALCHAETIDQNELDKLRDIGTYFSTELQNFMSNPKSKDELIDALMAVQV